MKPVMKRDGPTGHLHKFLCSKERHPRDYILVSLHSAPGHCVKARGLDIRFWWECHKEEITKKT
jgi:hypothetical protein